MILDTMFYEDFFAKRLSALRIQKGVSAREMSLAIGQNESYINRIENKKSLPSMEGFFYICEYLEVQPYAFFDVENNPRPIQNKRLLAYVNALSEEKYLAVENIARLLR